MPFITNNYFAIFTSILKSVFIICPNVSENVFHLILIWPDTLAVHGDEHLIINFLLPYWHDSRTLKEHKTEPEETKTFSWYAY